MKRLTSNKDPIGYLAWWRLGYRASNTSVISLEHRLYGDCCSTMYRENA